MNKEEVFPFVAKILNEMFEIPYDDITPESHLLDDLDLDSIDAVDLIVKLQKHTDRNINPEEFKQVRTVNDVVEAIKKVTDDSLIG